MESIKKTKDTHEDKSTVNNLNIDNLDVDIKVIERFGRVFGAFAAGAAVVFLLFRLFFFNSVRKYLEQYGIRIAGVGISMSETLNQWIICIIAVLLLLAGLRYLLKRFVKHKFIICTVLLVIVAFAVLFIINRRQTVHLLSIDQFIIAQSKAVTLVSMCLVCILAFFIFRFISVIRRKHHSEPKYIVIMTVCLISIVLFWFWPQMDTFSDLNYAKKFDYRGESFFVIFEDTQYYYAMGVEEQPVDSSAVLNRSRQCIIQKSGIPFTYTRYTEIR